MPSVQTVLHYTFSFPMMLKGLDPQNQGLEPSFQGQGRGAFKDCKLQRKCHRQLVYK